MSEKRTRKRGLKMSNYFEKLAPYLERGMAINTALILLEWDMETEAPIQGDDYTSKVVGILSGEYFATYNNEEVKKCIHKLKASKEMELLSEDEQAVIRELIKMVERLEPIPVKEYRAYHELLAKATNVWTKAKEQKKFSVFAPVLEKIIEYQKKFAKYKQKGKEELYDICLEEYEPGFHMKQLDDFFEKLKIELVPLIQKIVKKEDLIHKEYNYKEYPIEKQKEFCRFLAGYVGFDFNRGVIAESAHPFTTNLHNHDVRITNHYKEKNLESAMFSMIHESGHALYEMGVSDDLTQTLVGGGASMGMHESQSRFYENMIGKTKEFWKPIYPKLVETYEEQLKNVSLDEFIRGINQVKNGCVRTEADELTYPIHILIRYEIEKLIFENKVDIKELPKIWNQKYKEYLMIEPEDDAQGILQDIHWSGGSFGYFPSYAIGSAVAAQIYYHIKSIMPFETYLEEGNLTPIREYLRDKIHKYGMKKNTNELLMEMMQEEFNPKYYIQYLKEKYSKLYKL